MNDGDQSISVLADVEDHVSLHMIGIFEDLAHFREVPPPHVKGDLVPGPNLSCGVWILLFGLAQVPACDNVHGGLLRALSAARITMIRNLRILCKMKRSQGEIVIMQSIIETPDQVP
jgi:hypothetical protein